MEKMDTNDYLIDFPLSPAFIAEQVSAQNMQDAGGQSFFIGKIRADAVENSSVVGIEYSTYSSMVQKAMDAIKDKIYKKYDDVKSVIIFHSIGLVRAGESSMLVSVSAGHRKAAFHALEDTVDMIKHEAPIWKKELLKNGNHRWL